MLQHFTSSGWLVTATVNGMKGYGASTFFIGVFNKEHLAQKGRRDFIKKFNKENHHLKDITNQHVTINQISPNQMQSLLISEVYE